MVILKNVNYPESCFQCQFTGLKQTVHCGYIPPMTTGDTPKSRFCPLMDVKGELLEMVKQYE